MSTDPLSQPGRFGLSVTRLDVAAGASVTDLADDCNCLLTAGIDALEGMSDLASSPTSELREGWWSMLYTMRQARAVFDRLYTAAIDAEHRGQAQRFEARCNSLASPAHATAERANQ